MEFKVQRWYDNKNRALSNKWYAIGRMDILVISICGGGIYVLFELIKYHKTTQVVDLGGLKIAGILFLIAVAFNFTSQFLGYYSNSNEALYNNLKFLEAIGDKKVTEDELKVIDKRIKRLDFWLDCTNWGAVGFMFLGLTLLVAHTYVNI